MPGKFADGVYGRKPWQAPPEAAYPPQQYIGPFASNQERLLSQALTSQTLGREELQEFVRPPLPQVQLFPPRYGYVNTEYELSDIIDAPGRTPSQQRVESDYSQTPNTTQSTSRNALGDTI
jgi:hypothetical protein